MTTNLVVKVSRERLDMIREGRCEQVTIPANPHWNRKLHNPSTGRYYTGLRIIVRTYQKRPDYVISAKAGEIIKGDDHYTIRLLDPRILLPPFSHQLINEPRRNSIR